MIPLLITNFNDTLAQLNAEGTGFLLNLMSDIGKLILRDSDTVVNKLLAQINKNSIIGEFALKLNFLLQLHLFQVIIYVVY